MSVETVSIESTTFVKTRWSKAGERVDVVHTSPGEKQDKSFLVTVQSQSIAYRGQSSGIPPWNFNPARLVIDDPIGVCTRKSA